MSPADSIRARAEADQVLSDGGVRRDVYLWEHAQRIAVAAGQLAQLDGVPQPVDLAALEAAALYHDAGWAVQCREGGVSRLDVLARPTTDSQRETGAALLLTRLGDLLPRRSLEAAAAAIRQMNDRRTSLPEAQVLSEAENLDGVGMMGFWQMVRRHACEGRGVQSAIDAWNRQRDYHFWEARINDAFRFEATKALARSRLQVIARYYEELERIQSGEDLAAALTPMTGASP